MSFASKIKTMYLSVPLILGLCACTSTKTFVLVNSPKDLEYKLGDHDPAIRRNVDQGIDDARKKYFAMQSDDSKKEQEHKCYKMQNMAGMHGGMYNTIDSVHNCMNHDSSCMKPDTIMKMYNHMMHDKMMQKNMPKK